MAKASSELLQADVDGTLVYLNTYFESVPSTWR